MVIRKRLSGNNDKPKFGRDSKPKEKSSNRKFSSTGGDLKRKPFAGGKPKRDDDNRPYSKSKFGSEGRDSVL